MSLPFSLGPGDNREFGSGVANTTITIYFEHSSNNTSDTTTAKYPTAAIQNSDGDSSKYGQPAFNIVARADQSFEIVAIDGHTFAEPITVAGTASSWTEHFASAVRSIQIRYPTANTNAKIRWK